MTNRENTVKMVLYIFFLFEFPDSSCVEGETLAWSGKRKRIRRALLSGCSQ